MNTFKTHILAASNTFYEGECESLIVPTADGPVSYTHLTLPTICSV